MCIAMYTVSWTGTLQIKNINKYIKKKNLKLKANTFENFLLKKL